MNVYWLLAAQERLKAELHGRDDGLEVWLPKLNQVLDQVFSGQVVLVRDRYSGYRQFDGLVILFVEVQPSAGKAVCAFSPGTYIVKIAFDEKRASLRAEIDAWNKARPSFFHGDNVFVSLDAAPNEDEPIALVYSDANAVLGSRNVLSLEEAITQTCRFGVPKPRSVERILRMLFERLNTHFFAHVHIEEPNEYLKGDRPSLSALLDRFDEKLPLSTDPKQKYDDYVRQIRRETLALLAADDEQFADPIDLLHGLRNAGIGPPVLRGTSHGDLHGRNIQVSIVNDEVSQCAVFDYEKFSRSNLVAWDFHKLEIETSVRLLDQFGSRSIPEFARECMRFWHRVGQRAESADPRARVSFASEAPGVEWRRLEDLLVSLRMMAHDHLGRNRGRAFDWEAEYELLMVWYAVHAALYPNYEPRWRIAALIAGGVAARQLIRRMPAEVELSHRRRFIAAKDQARGIDTILNGMLALRTLAAEFPHVLEIQEELALAYIKLNHFKEAEATLEHIASRYRNDHTTAETPALLGSLWKHRAFAESTGDHKYDRYSLERALTWYRRAAERHQPDEYYPRINIATLLLLMGHPEKARDEARRVLELIDRQETHDFWAIASRGEAELLLGNDIEAAFNSYRHAVSDRYCRPLDRQAMHKQILEIRQHVSHKIRAQLTDEVLAGIFEMVEKTVS